MKERFEVVFLEEVIEFIENLDSKTRSKILYTIDKARFLNDPKLLKKLTNEIWEFRTKYNGNQYRIFAFWDKVGDKETLVVSTHAIIKKTSKVPVNEINKAEKIRLHYFNQKLN